MVAATTHSDLFVDLAPSVHVHKRFGEEIQVKYYPNQGAGQCSLVKEMHVEAGSMADWRMLSRFHYRGHRTVAPRKVFRLTRGDELCGVIVYSYPPPRCYGRKLVLPCLPLDELNKQLSIISRVVIHPKYRTIGLGAKLISETLPLAGTPCVELIAVMAKYSPFAEKAGMKRIAEQKSNNNLPEVSQALLQLGFDQQLLGSEHYVASKIDGLTNQEIDRLKEAFIKNRHLRFRQELTGGGPFVKPSDYSENVKRADNVKLAKLIKIASVLMQTKVYLFWKACDLGKAASESHSA